MIWVINNVGRALYGDEVFRMNAELTQLIEVEGKSEVVHKIREAHGVCPRIVKLHDNTYQFYRYARAMYIDWDEAPVYVNNTVSLSSLNLTNSGIIRNGHPVYVSYNPHYGPFRLSDIIEYGDVCEDCGAIFLNVDTHYTTCDACRLADEPLPYSTRAEELLEVEETKEILFGVELEYEGVSARDVKKTIPSHAIAKRDGSIHNGVEVVTRPASLETHKKALQVFFNQVHTQAAPNTGMHVHVERSKLSEYQIGFMMEFLNNSELVPFIERIAGREYSTNAYCRARDSVKMTEGLSFDEGALKLVRSNTDKYSPLNTAKRHTVEVRIFSSPESMLECAARLDFVNALVKYSSPYSVDVKRLKDKFNWDVFIDYIRRNTKQFPHFSALYL